MISILGFLLDLALWVLVAALTLGLLSGFAVLIWRWGRETLFFAHGFVLSWGDQGVAMAIDRVRERFPNILPEDKAGAEHARLRAEINSLQYALATAQGRAAGLSDLITELKRQVAASGSGPSDELYGRVGLHPASPDFVVVAVRRETRRHYHPDLHPGKRKAEYTRRFQDAEQAFDEIFQQRGLK
jgi:hypothetical protein